MEKALRVHDFVYLYLEIATILFGGGCDLCGKVPVLGYNQGVLLGVFVLVCNECSVMLTNKEEGICAPSLLPSALR